MGRIVSTRYRVKYKVYQYNTGQGLNDSGEFDFTSYFDTLKEAITFRAKLRTWVKNETEELTDEEKEFVAERVWDGYVSEVSDTIVKITEQTM
jgi:hypothetical protein